MKALENPKEERAAYQALKTVEKKMKQMKKAIDKQLKSSAYQSSNLYYIKNTSKNIANKLATVNLYVQKQFHD